ncbi:MAG: winged helix-turn-helix domain-containing protein [Methanobacteriota archaeon]
MDEVTETFGFNAGKLWRTLNAEGSLNEKTLEERTQLRSEDIFTAVGWLARENKIRQHDMQFQLGETDLMVPIGKNAGKVWKVLRIWENVGVLFIAQQARISISEVQEALGWLGREDKIASDIIDPALRTLVYRLK